MLSERIHAARLAIVIRAVSHFATNLLSDIDIHPLIASCEHDPSAFYIAHATLVEYNVKGTPRLTTPSLLAEVLPGCASIQYLLTTSTPWT
jgi:fatty acid synthase subunit alpha